MPQQKKLNNKDNVEKKADAKVKSVSAKKDSVSNANTVDKVVKADKVNSIKSDDKSKGKTTKVEAKKDKEIVVKKKKRVVKNKVTKSAEVKSNATKIKKKKSLPKFIGRFGKKFIRRKSVSKKWAKWRHPRGIDIYNLKEDGAMPKPGYGAPKSIWGLHPSGYKEVLVCNVKELEAVNPAIEAVKISSTVGLRKRNEIVTKANELKVRVLN